MGNSFPMSPSWSKYWEVAPGNTRITSAGDGVPAPLLAPEVSNVASTAEKRLAVQMRAPWMRRIGGIAPCTSCSVGSAGRGELPWMPAEIAKKQGALAGPHAKTAGLI